MDTQNSPEVTEPANLRWLRWLVTLLTITLILGVLTIVGLLVIRLNSFQSTTPAPDTIQVPAGESLTSYSIGPDWIVLITTDGSGTQRVHLVSPDTGDLHQTIEIAAD